MITQTTNPTPCASSKHNFNNYPDWDVRINTTLDNLSHLYKNVVVPVERAFEYNKFRLSWFEDTMVQRRPFALFLGPWSSGKSSFINFLLQRDILVTGPQPTTDKFTIIFPGKEDSIFPGRVLVSDSNLPFRGLTQFGDAFIECLEGRTCVHPLLRSVVLVDTPGVLEAAGDNKHRRYDYVEIVRWFVEKSDIVFVLFDISKLDTGPELRNLFIRALKHQEYKIRIVLNKADSVTSQELLRVYGSIFWSLSTLIVTTEPPRVYVSSLWNKPYKPESDHVLFSKEKTDLLFELIDTVPKQAIDRRVTAVIKRTKDVLLHALLCSTLSSRIPKFFGSKKARAEELRALNLLITELAVQNRASVDDFGSLAEYSNFFNHVKMDDLPSLSKLKKKGWTVQLQQLIDTRLPMLLKPIQETRVMDPSKKQNVMMVLGRYNVIPGRKLDAEEEQD